MWFGVTDKGRPESQHTCGHALLSQDALAEAWTAGQCSMCRMTLWLSGSPIRSWGLSPQDGPLRPARGVTAPSASLPGPPEGDLVRRWSLNPESALLVPRSESFLFFLTNKNYE